MELVAEVFVKCKKMYVRVRVTPNAKKESFEQINDDTFKISIKEKAENNLANNRVLELVSGHYNVPIKTIKIITGHHSPRKILFINNN